VICLNCRTSKDVFPMSLAIRTTLPLCHVCAAALFSGDFEALSDRYSDEPTIQRKAA
jgi:hypothetical protein